MSIDGNEHQGCNFIHHWIPPVGPPVPCTDNSNGATTDSAASITLNSCAYCGSYHSGTCGRVKAIEYHQNGTVKRVEFHEPRPAAAPDYLSWQYLGDSA